MERLIDMYPLTLPILPLQRMVLLKVAEQFWKLDETREELKRCIQSEALQTKPCSKFSERKKTIFNRLFEKIDQLTLLPSEVREDLKYVATYIGINILQWFQRFVQQRWTNIADDLRFDRFGFVDTVETLRSWYYSGRMESYVQNGKPMQLIFDYALEDCICDYFGKLSLQEREPEFSRIWGSDPSPFKRLVFNYWRSYIIDLPADISNEGSMNLIAEKFEELNCDIPTVSYQLLDYFLNNLTVEYKRKFIESVKIIKYTQVKYDGFAFAIDRVNFILKCMAEGRRADFYQQNMKVLETHVVGIYVQWPWQDLLVPMFKSFLNNIDHGIYYYVLIELLMMKHLENEILGGTNRISDLIRELWKNTPESTKSELTSLASYNAMLVLVLLMVSDIELLKELFEDDNLSAVRQLLLTFSSKSCQFNAVCGVMMDNLNSFERFMQNVLPSDEERRQFKKIFLMGTAELLEAQLANIREQILMELVN